MYLLIYNIEFFMIKLGPEAVLKKLQPITAKSVNPASQPVAFPRKLK